MDMQTPNKKRKIQVSPGGDEDDDWGNDFTAEDFDFLQSQVDEVVGSTVPNAVRTGQDTHQTVEEKHALEGEICMLRQSLKQKSQELEKLRVDQLQLANDNLKDRQEVEKKHRLDIDRLNSAIKFKEHELHNEQARTKLLESKIKSLSDGQTSSPAKYRQNVLVSRVTSAVNTATQTELASLEKQPTSFCLAMNSAYNTVEAYTPCVPKLNSRCLSSITEKSESDMKVFSNKASQFHISANDFQVSPLSCHCCHKTDFPSSNLAKEIYVLQNFEAQIQQCKNKLLYMEQNVSFTRKAKYCNLELIESTYKIFSDLCHFLATSRPACMFLVKYFKENSASGFSSETFVSLVASCGVPLLKNEKVVNGGVTTWVLQVLNFICDFCHNCCSSLCERAIQDIKIHEILATTCSIETAYLAIMFLQHCVGVRELFDHSKVECILLSLSKLLKMCFRSHDFRHEQIQCFVQCVELLGSAISLYSFKSVYSNKCKCFLGILDEIFSWICAKEIYEKDVLVIIFRFLHILFKCFREDNWYHFCSRLNKSFILTANKVFHTDCHELLSVKEIIRVLCEQESFS